MWVKKAASNGAQSRAHERARSTPSLGSGATAGAGSRTGVGTGVRRAAAGATVEGDRQDATLLIGPETDTT
jgi:hypothetical protein